MHDKITHDKHSLQVWLSHITAVSADTLENTRRLLSASENTRFDRIKSQLKRTEYLHSRTLIRQVLTHNFGFPLEYWSVIEQTQSAPLIENIPCSRFYSLSHSQGLIALSIAQFPNGIDVESTTKARDINRLFEFGFSQEEIRTIKHQPGNLQEKFYRLWCAKEAWYKALAPEEQAATNLYDLSYRNLITPNTHWHLYETQLPQYQLSVVTSEKPRDIILNYQHFNLSSPDNINFYHYADAAHQFTEPTE